MGIIENLKETTKLFMDSFLGSLVAGIPFGILGLFLSGGDFIVDAILYILVYFLKYAILAAPLISAASWYIGGDQGTHLIDPLLTILLAYMGYGGLAIPIISAIAFAILYPRVMKWYFENVTGQRINTNYT
ncbi:MAG: hypothetical protein ACP5G1_03105, partial [Nanopusillaceae archaeon]